MSRRQDGQALVGALVVTTLAFLLAGTVAVGASALLSQETNSHNGSSRDLAAQDALAAAVAQVAGKGNTGGSAPCSSPQILTATLPNTYVSRALCTRVDGIANDGLKLLQLLSPGCFQVDVSTYRSMSSSSNNHVRIWFSASGTASAWVDQTSGCKGPKSPICLDNPPQGSVSQVLLDCQFDDDPSFYLHVVNPSSSSGLIRLAQGDSAEGSVYVLAASTEPAGSAAYEEADLWVSADGLTTKLLFEGSL